MKIFQEILQIYVFLEDWEEEESVLSKPAVICSDPGSESGPGVVNVILWAARRWVTIAEVVVAFEL